MKELEDLTMELVAAQERGDMEEWKKVAGRIAELEGGGMVNDHEKLITLLVEDIRNKEKENIMEVARRIVDSAGENCACCHKTLNSVDGRKKILSSPVIIKGVIYKVCPDCERAIRWTEMMLAIKRGEDDSK